MRHQDKLSRWKKQQFSHEQAPRDKGPECLAGADLTPGQITACRDSLSTTNRARSLEQGRALRFSIHPHISADKLDDDWQPEQVLNALWLASCWSSVPCAGE